VNNGRSFSSTCADIKNFIEQVNVGKEMDKRRGTAKTSGKILEACRERNTITIPELAALIGKSERSIERNIQKLQQDRLLKRIGGRKGGHW
jgi:ATP-dependent DNA helicase RecG